jgi:hypothetical protein
MLERSRVEVDELEGFEGLLEEVDGGLWLRLVLSEGAGFFGAVVLGALCVVSREVSPLRSQ